MKKRVWASIAVLFVAAWATAAVRHFLAENWGGLVTSSLGLVAVLLIVGAVLSRSRKSMYPREG